MRWFARADDLPARLKLTQGPLYVANWLVVAGGRAQIVDRATGAQRSDGSMFSVLLWPGFFLGVEAHTFECGVSLGWIPTVWGGDGGFLSRFAFGLPLEPPSLSRRKTLRRVAAGPLALSLEW